MKDAQAEHMKVKMGLIEKIEQRIVENFTLGMSHRVDLTLIEGMKQKRRE